MGIKEDYEILKEKGEINDIAKKIRAEEEYALRELEEYLASWEEDMKKTCWIAAPESIKSEGTSIKEKYKTLVEDLRINHSEFLTIG